MEKKYTPGEQTKLPSVEEQAQELEELRDKFPTVQLPTGGIMSTPIPVSEMMRESTKEQEIAVAT